MRLIGFRSGTEGDLYVEGIVGVVLSVAVIVWAIATNLYINMTDIHLRTVLSGTQDVWPLVNIYQFDQNCPSKSNTWSGPVNVLAISQKDAQNHIHAIRYSCAIRPHQKDTTAYRP